MTFILTILFSIVPAQAQTCTPQDGVVKIGCISNCDRSYQTALQQAATTLGYRVEISVITPYANPAQTLAGLDGILSPGGHDIDPSLFTRRSSAAEKARLEQLHRQYGNDGRSEARHLARDQHEYRVMQTYFNDIRFARMPLLGVCYGMQMMAAVHDIPLYVDLRAELGIPAQRGVHNDIRFSSSDQGYLRGMPAGFSGFKNHHQGVNVDALRRHSNIRLKATSHNGRVAEVIEAVNRPAVGVQFHAEAHSQSDPRVATALYGWMLKQACHHRNSRLTTAQPPPAPRTVPPLRPHTEQTSPRTEPPSARPRTEPARPDTGVSSSGGFILR